MGQSADCPLFPPAHPSHLNPQSSGLPTHPTRRRKGHCPGLLASLCLPGSLRHRDKPQDAPWWMCSALAALQRMPGCCPGDSG